MSDGLWVILTLISGQSHTPIRIFPATRRDVSALFFLLSLSRFCLLQPGFAWLLVSCESRATLLQTAAVCIVIVIVSDCDNNLLVVDLAVLRLSILRRS